MSGQQWGAVIGGVIGAFFGMPQLGAAIGGMIGGWIDPTQVNGPRIGDGAAQSSAEGQPIAWIMGTAGWVQGNIVQKSKRREVKKTDDGKGSGTEINTFEAHQDFCIMICESSETRDSLMVGVLIVRIDGKIVYDMRPGKNMGADNAKFLKNHKFYDGNEAQMPDPTMEAITGVGNTPSYRGVYTIVCRDVNLTQYGDRIPQYEFVMVGAGQNESETVTSLRVPELSSFINSEWPLADPESQYELFGIRPSAAWPPYPEFEGASIAEIIATASMYGGTATEFLGWSVVRSDSRYLFNDISPENDDEILLFYNNPQSVQGLLDQLPYGNSANCMAIAPDGNWWLGANGIVFKRQDATAPYDLMQSCTGSDDVVGMYPLTIRVKRKVKIPESVIGDPCQLGFPVLLPDAPGFVIDCDGNITPEEEYTLVAGSFRILQQQAFSLIDGRKVYSKYNLGPVLVLGSANDNQTYWEARYDQAVIDGDMPPGLVYGVGYPISVSSAWEATATTTSLVEEPLSVATAITRIAVRGGLTPDDIVVTDLEEFDLLGYSINQSYNGAESMLPPLASATAYGTEYDGQIHFQVHGEPVKAVVDPQDLVSTGDIDKDTRQQKVEFPRLVSVTAIDPDQDYTARPQSDRRISLDVRAIGEQQIQIPVVMTADRCRQLAAIAMKVAWARAEARRTFSLPYAQNDVYLSMVAGEAFAMDGKRYVTDKMRLEDGEIFIDSVFDRQSAYTSDVTATPALPPTPPPSGIQGVTIAAFLNMPVGRDQDDRLGIYGAFCGLLDAWQGAVVQMSSDGMVSWQTVIPEATAQSTIGYLLDPLPKAPEAGDDVTNTLRVAVHGGQLNSITRNQYLNEGNPAVIVKPDNTVEVIQFQDAAEDAEDEYSLTTLARERLATVAIDHAAGAQFVAMDAAYFIELPISLIGRTLYFRPVTFGTPPESNAVYAVLFDPAVSQTEWAPCYLRGRYGIGSSFQLSVVPRHRLGTDVTPVASSNFTGFRWTGTDGTTTLAQDTLDPSAVFDLTSFSGTITFSVSQLNRITGPGPSASITL